MKLEEILEQWDGWRIGYRHNPDHFYPNSFKVIRHDGRFAIRGKAMPHVGKNFKIVGILKRE